MMVLKDATWQFARLWLFRSHVLFETWLIIAVWTSRQQLSCFLYISSAKHTQMIDDRLAPCWKKGASVARASLLEDVEGQHVTLSFHSEVEAAFLRSFARTSITGCLTVDCNT
ncbi:hypothetical protein N657DRAFT_54412 [Parathielavia appendiculata]|uniref:Uncharacterized protein n=1 Tax=Parathielavia appendiculata TaxID=2587402 RepID=A0AAN6UA06_9PEZI|nr:hypothetical protein N657DRAFT_54412 [Parathielavia appendiculata]